MKNEPRERYILQEPFTNRALLRDGGEKWPDDINGEPSDKWVRIVEYSEYSKAMEERQHFWSICVKRAEEVKALKQKLEEHADSINCIVCGSLGEIVVEDFTARGVTVKAAYRKCTKCDMTWLTGKQEHTIDKRIIESLDDARSHWQAKAIELEKEITNWRNTAMKEADEVVRMNVDIFKLNKENHKLKTQNYKLRNTVQYYADGCPVQTYPNGDWEQTCPIVEEAQKCLKEIEEK